MARARCKRPVSRMQHRSSLREGGRAALSARGFPAPKARGAQQRAWQGSRPSSVESPALSGSPSNFSSSAFPPGPGFPGRGAHGPAPHPGPGPGHKVPARCDPPRPPEARSPRGRTSGGSGTLGPGSRRPRIEGPTLGWGSKPEADESRARRPPRAGPGAGASAPTGPVRETAQAGRPEAAARPRPRHVAPPPATARPARLCANGAEPPEGAGRGGPARRPRARM